MIFYVPDSHLLPGIVLCQIFYKARYGMYLFITEAFYGFQNLFFGGGKSLDGKDFAGAVFQPMFVDMKDFFDQKEDPFRRNGLALYDL